MQKNTNDLSIENIGPLPKAVPRVQSNRKRTRKSAVLTDTPEKNALEEEHHLRELKKKKTTPKIQNKGKNKKDKVKNRGKEDEKIKAKYEKVEKVKKHILNESSDSEADEYFCIVCGVSYNDDIHQVETGFSVYLVSSGPNLGVSKVTQHHSLA